MLVLIAGCDGAYVDRVVLVNNTDYRLVVEVRGEPSRGWLLLGTAEKGRATPFQEVIDQGDTWIFRFSYGGEEGGHLRMTRAELQRRSWRMEVPPEVAERLRAKGFPPSYT